jgi:hypothetical protein
MNASTPFQPLIDHTQAQAHLWLDATRENLSRGMALVERAIDARSAEDAKALIEAAGATSRESFERGLATSQQAFQASATFAQEQTQAIHKTLGNGVPNLETLLNPATYGLGKATAKTKAR